MSSSEEFSGYTEEGRRLETLASYEIMDTDLEQAYDDLVALASYICQAPIAAISLVDDHRQWFKASVGLDDRETPRDISFCQHTIRQDDLFVVPDATVDERFADSPLVTHNPGVRFYAGAPLIAPDGCRIGALCVKDTKARELSPDQLDALKRLSRQVVAQMELTKSVATLQGQTDLLEKHTEDLNEAHRFALKMHREAQGAVQSLSESEQKFRAFAENASDAIFLHDGEGNILYVNRAACESLGYEQDQLLGMSMSSLEIGISASDLKEQWSIAEAGGHSTYDGLYLAKCGRAVSMEVKTSSFSLEGSTRFFAIARDQTESLRVMATLRASEERFNLVCDATSDVVWDLDLINSAIWTSPNYGRVFGTTGDRCPTLEEWIDAIHPDDRDRVNQTFHQALKECKPCWEEEYRHIRPSGAYAEVLDRAYLVLDEHDKPVRMIGAMMDQTSRKIAEKARRDQEDAERANLAKSSFLSRMSHELRTPLNSILGFAQLLEMGSPTDQQKDCIGRILMGGRHLLGLINEVLDLSRIESGNIELSVEPVHAGGVIEEAIGLTSPAARARSIKVNYPGGESNFVKADRQRLLQVLINLISNGIKYNNEGGTVSITCEEQMDRLVFKVADSGIGIDPEHRDRVFIPFDRLGIEQRCKIEGTGLGLALTKTLVDAMGGTICFESEVGQGSEFVIELEKAQRPQVEQCKLLVEEEVSVATDRRIVYIEDNESNVALMESIFGSIPTWSLESYRCGSDGLAAVERSLPDLLLLDLDLPDIPGSQILKLLRDNPETQLLPILVVSADATSGRIERLMDNGANGYIAKPYDVRDLLREVTKLVEVGRMHAA